MDMRSHNDPPRDLYKDDLSRVMEPKHVVAKGATRSEKAPPYHLVPREGFRRTALRFALGAEKHGEWNWLKACDSESDAAKWAQEAYNHMIEHAVKMPLESDLSDDHLGAIGWAQTVLCYLEEKFQKPWTQLVVASAFPDLPRPEPIRKG